MIHTKPQTNDHYNTDSYLPNYMSLAASLLAPGLLPTSKHLLPNEAWLNNTDFLKQMPKWMLLLTSLTGNIDLIIRSGYTAQANEQRWKDLETRERDRINSSIDHLNLANKAMFTLLAEQWGITETDVATRADDIFTAELQAFIDQGIASTPE